MPGTTDNFASNEVIVTGLESSEVWPFLINTSLWPQYYANASDIHFDNGVGPDLFEGAIFRFTTFGLIVEAEVKEFIRPEGKEPGRIAWTGYVDKGKKNQLNVYHAWLIENLDDNRVRVLTQESQIGEPAKEMATTKPNPMINAHQDWLEGLVNIAKEHKGGQQ